MNGKFATVHVTCLYYSWEGDEKVDLSFQFSNIYLEMQCVNATSLVKYIFLGPVVNGGLKLQCSESSNERFKVNW